ncbi:hypothetical protein JWH16_00395, partial [Xanthomonas campestris pv. campestris]
ESSLCALDGVREAAVMVRGHEAQRQLVAYVVADGQGGSPQSCRAQLLQRLPEHMVPSAYVELAALPLTPNGKLDRQALPAPDDEAVARRAYRAPEGTTEQAIADVWCELLGLERVGRDDHFFELGGHSLLAIQVVSRLRQKLSVELAVRELFARPALADLAEAVASAHTDTLPPLLPADRSGALPLSWAQQRLWFLDQLDQAAGGAYHMPVALRLRGAL